MLDSYIKVIDRRHIEGYRRSEGWAENQVVYFYAEFSKQMESCSLINGAFTASPSDTNHAAHGTEVKACFQFHTSKNESIYVKVAISQTSMEGAKINRREIMTWDFEATKRNAEATWNYELNKINVSTNNEEQKKFSSPHFIIA